MVVEVTRIIENGDELYRVEGEENLLTEDELHEKYFLCVVCEEWHPIDEKYGVLEDDDDKPFCNDCRDNGDVSYCEHCETYTIQEMYDIEGDYICESCRDDMEEDGVIACCNRCGEYFYTENGIYMQDTDNWYCRHCSGWIDYYCCENCGEYYEDEDSGEWDEDGDCWYCSSCAEECISHGPIGDYHDMKGRDDIEFHGEERETELHMGAEIELAGGYHVGEIAQWVVDTFNDGDRTGFMNPERDCSVAVEIISEPATISYWKSLESKLDEFFAMIKNEGHNTTRNNGAGGHIHCDRDWFEAQEGFTSWGDVIMKLEYIFSRYYYELLAFSRRPYEGRAWGGYHHYYKRPQNSSRTIYNAMRDDSYCSELNDRYYALNVTNRHTIEFRIFGCYDSTVRLMASLKLAKRLCTLSVTKTMAEIYDMTFEDILGDDEDIRTIWVAERSRFFEYIKGVWITIPEDYKTLYIAEYPEFKPNDSTNLRTIKERI